MREVLKRPTSNGVALSPGGTALRDDRIAQRDMRGAIIGVDGDEIENGRDVRVEDEDDAQTGTLVDYRDNGVEQNATRVASMNSGSQRAALTRVTTSRRTARVLGVPITEEDASGADTGMRDDGTALSGNGAQEHAEAATAECSTVVESILQEEEEEVLSEEEDGEVDDAEEFAMDNVVEESPTDLQRSHAKVLNTLHELLVNLRKGLPSADNTANDLLLHKRVAGCGLAVSYQGAVAGPNGVRTLAIYLDLAPKLRLATKRIACVRFMYSNRMDNDDSYVDTEQISASCSCSTTMGAAVCEHAQLIATASYKIRNEVEFILSYKSRRTLSETPNECRALFLGTRKPNSKASWIVVRHNALNELTSNYVPVMEAAPAKRSGKSIDNRVTCKRCRYAPDERGLCEHEDAVVERVKELDSEIPETNVPNVPSYRAKRYESVLPRRLFPCPSEKAELRELGRVLTLLYEERVRNSEVDENGVVSGGLENLRVNYEAWDKERTCPKCGMVMFGDPEKRNCKMDYREVWLHTLLHGSMWIKVYDMQCSNCNEQTCFDGRDCALFATSMITVYTREILDVLIFHICMLGGTFREGYEIMKMTANTTSAQLVRWGGFPLNCKRHKTNDAFSLFLRTIELASDEALRSVFSCSTCESRNYDGTTSIEAVVMDGTATGILGTLPRFVRPALNVSAANDTASHQFLIRLMNPRKFLSLLFRLAKKCGTRRSFSIELPGKTTCEKLEHLLFRDTPEDGGIGLSTIFPILFDTPNLQKILKERSVVALGACKVEIYPKLRRIPLRSAMSHILHSFILEAVPTGLLMSERHEIAASRMILALDAFVNCCHFAAIPSRSYEMVCSQCCMNFAKAGESVSNLLPVISNFVNVVCEGVVENHVQPYRTLARFIANLLSCTQKALAGFKELFADQQTECCRSYTEKYKEPNFFAFRSEHSEPIQKSAAVSENALECSLNIPNSDTDTRSNLRSTISKSDAADTGEFFPTRPLIRPRVRFKNKPEDTCGDNCTKEYPWHHRHSPGLFTVQCACSKPKLLGVVVMNEAESLATALSSILTRFNPLPRTIYYDNACNLAHSVALRFGWMFNETRFLCDRFHYTAHTCSAVFNPDAYKCADPSKTSSAEAINRLWKNSRNHVRYLAGRNLIPFIYSRSVFINLRAKLKETDDFSEVADKNVYKLADQLMPCTCSRCKLPHDDGGN